MSRESGIISTGRCAIAILTRVRGRFVLNNRLLSVVAVTFSALHLLCRPQKPQIITPSGCGSNGDPCSRPGSWPSCLQALLLLLQGVPAPAVA